MVPILRTFRHSDGGLAFFNGSSDSSSKNVSAILKKSGVKSRAISSAPHSGFQRLYSGKTNVLIDTGSPPLEAANKWGHSGTLGFEMSSGKNRIIVNTSKKFGIKITKIGKINSGSRKSLIVGEKGKKLVLKNKGYIHQF